jgi:glycosyltransferase involved in cell wall biosynthesis
MAKLVAWLLRHISALLPPSMKRSIKRVIDRRISVSLQRVMQRNSTVEVLRVKMLEMGFVEKAYEDLRKIASDRPNKKTTRLAAQELALWHADQYTPSDALKSLEYLRVASHGASQPNVKRQIAVMQAEGLRMLGQSEEAGTVIRDALVQSKHADLYLAAANLETLSEEKIGWINQALRHCGLSEVALRPAHEDELFDRLVPVGMNRTIHRGPKVTVIMPVYNAEGSIRTALESILSQTWTNLEVLVVDDCSKDSTAQIVRQYKSRDHRVKLIMADANRGPYVARNLALQEATGELVTCHDADDWSHPEKIERQVLHLLNNPNVIGNTSQQARAKDDLTFYRRGRFGQYIFANMSSFMFRRLPVMEMVGYWDSVRFGADSEFIRRIRICFGNRAIVDLETGPLSFQRQTAASLTGNSSFGYHGYFMGARKEYYESFLDYHVKSRSLKYGFPQDTRPFPVPESLKPVRGKIGERRHFDVIMAADFRMGHHANSNFLEEIKASRRPGKRIGLVQMYRYDYPVCSIDPSVRELVDGNQVQIVVYGENVSCDCLIVRSPLVLQEKQRYIPDIKAEQICVIMDQTPLSAYGPRGKVRYEIERCAQHLREYFGKDGLWYPVNPLVRDALYRHHSRNLKAIKLADHDWFHIFNRG